MATLQRMDVGELKAVMVSHGYKGLSGKSRKELLAIIDSDIEGEDEKDGGKRMMLTSAGEIGVEKDGKRARKVIDLCDDSDDESDDGWEPEEE